MVLHRDAAGGGAVLWPSAEVPAPGRPALLPAPNEQDAGFEIHASLLRPGEATRESLVVYAFAEKALFDRYAPGPDADAARLSTALTTALSQVAPTKWARQIVPYVIEPRR